MKVNDANEACFKIVALGTHDAVELVRALHGSTKEEHRTELMVSGDDTWTVASFEMALAGVTSRERKVRAQLFGHRGSGLRQAPNADLERAFADADVAIVRGGSDLEDDLNASSTLLQGGKLPSDAIVVVDAPGASAAISASAPARFAPRSTHVRSTEGSELELLKLALKAVLAREARKTDG